jgi:hypothetical protein
MSQKRKRQDSVGGDGLHTATNPTIMPTTAATETTPDSDNDLPQQSPTGRAPSEQSSIATAALADDLRTSTAAIFTAPTTSQPPPHSRQDDTVQVVSGGNRARFMAGLQPSKVCCDLTSAPVTPGMRFSFEAIVLVVYPAKMTPPERRYVELMDEYGTTGITVWNAYVHALKPTAVGCVVKFNRLSISLHNGKKSLTMAKDSTMHLESAEHTGQLPKWWTGLLTQPAFTCAQFHDVAISSVVNVAGILGFIHQEEKIVNGEVKLLLILYLTDKTGKMEIRSWNHSDAEFLQHRERPVQFNRVRVCQYAGTKTAELLTGPNGTQIATNFDSADLEAYWKE